MLKSLFLSALLFVAMTLLIAKASFSSPLPQGTLFPPFMPEMVLSPSDCSISEACFRVPLGTVQTLNSWFSDTWCLKILPAQACSVRNPISSVFKVRCRLGDWVFQVVDYPFHC